MKKKGSILLETIIVTVIMISILLSFYMIYAKNIINEKEKIYYDDIAYVYKTQIVKEIIKANIRKDDITKESFLKLDVSSVPDAPLVYGMGLLNNKNEKFFENDEIINKLYTETYSNIIMLPILIKIGDINTLKQCIKNVDRHDKCKAVKSFLTLSYPMISNKILSYIKQLNVPEPKSGSTDDYILITIFIRNRNGDNIVNSNNYEACLHSKIINNKDIICNGCEDKETIKKYYKQDKIRYNMSCETTYYFSWVYYGKL